MIKQCKGKDLDDVSKSKLLLNNYFLSKKFDGHYIQIHKINKSVRFFTSGGKEFAIPEIENELVTLNPTSSFMIEAEYIGTSLGKLGDRTKVGKLTTYRTNFEKGLKTPFDSRERFKVFDIIMAPTIPFCDRLDCLETLSLGNYLELVDNIKGLSIEDCEDIARDYVKLGYEGAYIKHYYHTYLPGKRVNDAIKLKYRKTADLLCIDIIDGSGKYVGMIGSLVLQDSKGRIVAVGSGLDDNLRTKKKEYFLGKVIEFEYEQIIDTYIQPTFIRVREDKCVKDID